MNVVMPTAMSTIHDEEELRQSSSRTATRGLSVLTAIAGEDPSVKSNAEAILNVAMDRKEENPVDSTLVEVSLISNPSNATRMF